MGGGRSVLVFLAWKSLASSPFSLAMLLGAVATAVAFQVPNAANLAGYSAELLDQGVRSGAGDVRLRPRGHSRFEDADALAARIEELPGIHAAVPALVLPGAAGKNGVYYPAPVVGVDPTARRRPYRLRAGETGRAGKPIGGMYLGISLAAKLHAQIGDVAELRVMLDAGASSDLFGSPGASLGRFDKRVEGTMRGVFTTEHMVVVDRDFLARAARDPGTASVIFVYTDAPAQARPVARELEKAFPEVEATAWVDEVAMLATELRVNQSLGAISAAMGAVTVAFPIWALLHLSVLYQRRDIALLSATGFSAWDIFVIYLLKALVVAILGTAVGLAVGYGLIQWFQVHPIFEDEHFVVHPLPTMLSFVQPAVVVLVTALIAGVYPAWRASRVEPAEALRSLD